MHSTMSTAWTSKIFVQVTIFASQLRRICAYLGCTCFILYLYLVIYSSFLKSVSMSFSANVMLVSLQSIFHHLQNVVQLKVEKIKQGVFIPVIVKLMITSWNWFAHIFRWCCWNRRCHGHHVIQHKDCDIRYTSIHYRTTTCSLKIHMRLHDWHPNPTNQHSSTFL